MEVAGDGKPGEEVLEFGVSGLLLYSTLVLYDRSDLALWSMLELKALSGPRVNSPLRTHPVEMMTIGTYRAEHPAGSIVTFDDTGLQRPYQSEGVRAMTFERPLDFLLQYVPEMGKELPARTLGLGILAGDRVIFVTSEAARGTPVTIETALGVVIVEASDAGMRCLGSPRGVQTVQAEYFAWSAYHPETEIIHVEPLTESGAGEG